MKHYVCTGGCNGVSDAPGVCGDKTCLKHSQPLHVCDCEDNTHHGLLIACINCGTLCRTKGGCKVIPFNKELT